MFQGNYYVRDGKHFVFIKETEQARAATQINVVLNRFDDLKLRIGAGAKR
jgi:hypothetical protein